MPAADRSDTTIIIVMYVPVATCSAFAERWHVACCKPVVRHAFDTSAVVFYHKAMFCWALGLG